MKIPISRTQFTAEELASVLEPLESGWIVQGPKVKEFEERWCAFTGASHSVAVTSCTTALHMSLVALGVGPGDEVLVPSFTWVATANSVEYVGARPILCDISLKTFNITAEEVERRVTSKTRAMIPVHLFGLAAPMDELGDIARRHSLKMVEDAACGFASRFGSRHVGTFGEAGCFSFHPRKAISTGEGGMITTEDGALAVKLRSLRDHGATISDFQRHHGARPYVLPEFPHVGFNYRMTDIQAAIGAAQMKRADDIHARRSALARRYVEALQDLPWLHTPVCPDGYVHGYQAFVCLFGAESPAAPDAAKIQARRNAFMEYLQQHGIATRPGTHAIHLLGFYRDRYGYKPADLPQSLLADHCSIALPLFPAMTDEELDFVVERIRSYRGA